MDPTARRLRLEPSELIRRAGLETHPAVDALAKATFDLPERSECHVFEANGTRPGARTP